MSRRLPHAGRSGDDAGFTLIELLVAASMSLIVVGALVMVLTSVLANQPANADRAAQIENARVMLERMVRELRQGRPVSGAPGSATSVTVEVPILGSSSSWQQITYSCTSATGNATCTRTVGTAAATTVLTGLASPNVFSYGTTNSPSCQSASAGTPSFICLKLTYPAEDGAETVTIEDSAFLRNTSA